MEKTNLGGDIPCYDCTTDENIVWSTDSTYWNIVMGKDKERIVCVHCFVKRAESQHEVSRWRVFPEFKIKIRS